MQRASQGLRLALWMGVVGTGLASAQTELRTLQGNSPGDEFGQALLRAGDVDADGLEDLIVGAYRNDPHGSSSGSATVYSGRDGTPIWHFEGLLPGIELGHSVAGVGDLDGDGHDDVIVGADRNRANGVDSGSAWVYSGREGSVLFTFHGDAPGDRFGLPVRPAGDVNGDGVPDIIIGARQADQGAVDRGSARVFSGADGSVLYTFYGEAAFDELGHWVAAAGDVNGDGFADVMAGAHRDDRAGRNAGAVRVYSGFDGSILFDLLGAAADDRFGRCVSGVGDLDQDGHDDFMVGAHQASSAGSYAGRAYVYSGRDASLLFDFHGAAAGDLFGHSLESAGDVNSDGRPDLIIGATRDDHGGLDAGASFLYSGSTGSLLYRFEGKSDGESFGFPSAGAGDVNGDGREDVAMGAHQSDSAGVDAGEARICSGNDLFLQCTPRQVSVGQNLSFCTSGAEPGMLVMTFVVAVNGAPFFVRLPLVGVLGASGQFQAGGTVPNSTTFTQGLSLTFRSYGLTGAGQIVDSAPETVTFQGP